MKFFIDTAEIDEIKTLNDMGLVDGVTTNPSLIKKSGRDHEETIREISSIIDGPISVETISDSYDGMIQEANEYKTWGKNIVIKVVMNSEGMKVVRALTKLNIQTNVTVTFSANQALIAAKAGATYVSPFVGRLDDIGHSGMDLIREIKTIYSHFNFTTNILVASVRSPLHVTEAAKIGADVATIPPKILQQLFKHPLTDNGIAQFNEDAKAWKKLTNVHS